jgi:hypothetical protein
VLRRKRMEGKTQEAAAAAAGMSVRSARKWERGLCPSQRGTPRTWRTRGDPFAEVFEGEVVALLAADRDGVLEATTLLGELKSSSGPVQQGATANSATPGASVARPERAGEGSVLSAGASTRTRSRL